MKNIGRLKRCKVRDIWDNENDFSDWLYDEENMDHLCEALGIDPIQATAREEHVGDFRIDIFGEENGSGRKVIIENQFEASNHDHLGKIITYAAGKDASIIIWIVEEVRPEHARAIEWLNLNIEDRGFFLVQLEVFRIGDSLPAPIFTVVQKPNEWVQAIKDDVDGFKQFRYTYWEGFVNRAKNNKEFCAVFPTENRKPSRDHWFSYFKGCKGDYHLELKLFHRNGKVNAEAIDVWVSDNKEFFSKFEDHRVEIEKELGYALEWYNNSDKKAACARIKRELGENEPLDYAYDWYMKTSLQLRSVFNKYA